MRCLYCHNPDTWEIGTGKQVTVAEIIAEVIKNRAFYNGGGITATGGEPLLQIDFLIELFKSAKENGIHTCLDTSGATYNKSNTSYCEKLDILMQYTDLCMLDIKHINPESHKRLTGQDNKNILAFAKYLEEKNIPVWIRHIIVEGHTDNPQDLINLGLFIGKLTNLKALDVLPYHTMGVSKYKELGLAYPLEGMPPLSVSQAITAKEYILKGIKQARNPR